MARRRGKGQRFDKWWQKNNELYHIYWYIGRDIDSEINKTIDEVEKITPYSDYEIKDKENLLEQLTLLKKLQREVKKRL